MGGRRNQNPLKQLQNSTPEEGHVAGVLNDPEQQLGEFAVAQSDLESRYTGKVQDHMLTWISTEVRKLKDLPNKPNSASPNNMVKQLHTQADLHPTGNPVESKGPWRAAGPNYMSGHERHGYVYIKNQGGYTYNRVLDRLDKKLRGIPHWL